MISTEIEELVDLCDRIVVISRGELTGEVENTAGVEERVGALMVARTGRRRVSARAARLGEAILTAAVPILLALVVIGILLAALGRDPFTFYARHVRPRADPVGGLSGEHHPQRAAAPDRRRA